MASSLDCAIALAEIDVIAMFIADDLHFDMARVDDHLFEIDVGIVEAHFGFGAGCGKLPHEIIGIMGDADPFSSAAGRRFDENRETESFWLL